MKKIVLLSLLVTSLNVSAKLCDVGQFAELEPIADAPFESHLKCLRSIADAPTTPTWPQGLFKKINGEEVFTGHCNLKDGKDVTSYMIMSSKGIKAIRYPVYRFMTGIDNDYLPGDVTHFKADGKDYFVSPSYGEARILTKDQLPAMAEELMKSMSKINGQIKKYEDWLKARGLMDSINVTTDPAAVAAVMPCLADHQADTVKLYVSGKFGPSMPAYGTIIGDYNKFNDLDPVARKKYERPFEDWKKEIIADLVNTHPVCQGIIDNAQVEDAFEKSWGKNKQYYEMIRTRFFPQSPN
jgi:hypothetical protein